MIHIFFLIKQIEAVDMDKGPGGRVRYKLAKPEKLFNINPYTGDLIVKMDLKEFGNNECFNTSLN